MPALLLSRVQDHEFLLQVHVIPAKPVDFAYPGHGIPNGTEIVVSAGLKGSHFRRNKWAPLSLRAKHTLFAQRQRLDTRWLNL